MNEVSLSELSIERLLALAWHGRGRYTLSATEEQIYLNLLKGGYVDNDGGVIVQKGRSSPHWQPYQMPMP